MVKPPKQTKFTAEMMSANFIPIFINRPLVMRKIIRSYLLFWILQP